MSELFPRLEIDSEVGAAYIAISDDKIVRTRSVNRYVNVDLNSMNVVVGIEVLDLHGEMPTQLLVDRYHVHSRAIDLVRSIRPTVNSFVTGVSTSRTSVAVGSGQRHLTSC